MNSKTKAAAFILYRKLNGYVVQKNTILYLLRIHRDRGLIPDVSGKEQKVINAVWNSIRR